MILKIPEYSMENRNTAYKIIIKKLKSFFFFFAKQSFSDKLFKHKSLSVILSCFPVKKNIKTSLNHLLEMHIENMKSCFFFKSNKNVFMIKTTLYISQWGWKLILPLNWVDFSEPIGRYFFFTSWDPIDVLCFKFNFFLKFSLLGLNRVLKPS